MEKPKIVVRGFSLTEYEARIVERESLERNLFNESAALRQIIREWDEQKQKSEQAVPINR